MSAADTVYRSLPVWAQHAAVSAWGLRWRWLRFGGDSTLYAAEFSARDTWDLERWQKWQQDSVTEVLRLAARNVPYYRDTWSREQKQAAQAGDLAGLPLLEKEPVRAQPRRFVAPGHVGREHVFYTSGSTGTPIASIWTTEELRRAMAVREVRSAGWAGVSFEQPRATFSGRIVVPPAASRGPYHRFNRAERQVYFSAFHLGPRTVADYLRALDQHGIRWLTGYAVSAYLLARYALEGGHDVPKLDAIITTSEKLTDAMRQTLSEAFDCRVYEEYSTVENVLFASECEEGSLHLSPDVGLVEVLDSDGTPCAPGEIGEVVTTNLMRTHQPMVRFRLGDLARLSDRPCACGRNLPILDEVVGRLEDVVRGPDGREVASFYGAFFGIPSVVETQIVQHALDHVELRVVMADGLAPGTRAQLEVRMHERLGPGVTITVTPVNEIPRTEAGKFRAVVSHLRNERADALPGADLRSSPDPSGGDPS